MSWEHFTDDELSCRCCGEMHMDNNFMSKLVLLRKICKFPLPISSGYRCQKHNDEVSTTGRHGPHTTGHAGDISIMGDKALTVISLAIYVGFTGVGVKQRGMDRFIHLDDLDATQDRIRPWCWSY